MGTVRKVAGGYKAEVCVHYVRDYKTLPSLSLANAWMAAREKELEESGVPDNTVKAALYRYMREESPKHKGKQWELLRLIAMGKLPIAKVKLAALKSAHLSEWRNNRLASVSKATVLREMNLLHSVFESCRRDWGWLKDNPLKDVKRPQAPPSRKRRITQGEIDLIMLGLNYKSGKPETISHRIALAFLFALETAMRAGEIGALTWADVGDYSVTLQATKNGDVRQVPLSKRARDILGLLPKTGDLVFNVTTKQRDALFRKARAKVSIDNLHFHDSRAEAIWRLSKKLDVMELARVIGHRNLSSLLIYYNASADELAMKLG